MRRNAKHFLLLGLGWFLVVFGIFWLFLPPLPGILFIAIGLTLLARRSPRIRLLVWRLGQRYPKFRIGLNRARAEIRRFPQRFSPSCSNIDKS
jgi:Flp pilus assembly protein TadB